MISPTRKNATTIVATALTTHDTHDQKKRVVESKIASAMKIGPTARYSASPSLAISTTYAQTNSMIAAAIATRIHAAIKSRWNIHPPVPASVWIATAKLSMAIWTWSISPHGDWLIGTMVAAFGSIIFARSYIVPSIAGM